VTRATGDAAGLERVMREVIQMRSSVSQNSRKPLRESVERPRSHISPFFRNVIHPEI
jgi:hypothetical protein